MSTQAAIRLGLPKGRMQEGVFSLLRDAGIRVSSSERTYRPGISLSNFEVKILKPQNIVEMLHAGSRDLGFAGADWVVELGANVVELVDTELDPVMLVAACPRELLSSDETLPKRHIVIASEYERLTKRWIAEDGLDASFVHSYGATEVFPPEDADCIVDNSATGSTLRANNLVAVKTLMRSSTRLYANPAALDSPERREVIERFVMLVNSVLQARNRAMVEVNVSHECFEAVLSVLPAMRKPTVSELQGQSGFAIKAAVPRKDLANLIPELKAKGASDIIVSEIAQIVP